MKVMEPKIHAFEDKQYVSLAAYKELNEDRDWAVKEMDEMRRNGNMTDAEIEDITRIRAEHTLMNDRINELTVFMRDHYQREIALGQHANMKDSIDAAMFYMGRERMMTKGAEK
jgi:hypothetical protein